jgi:hypothetical protein
LKRLGSKGVDEILNHPFFKDIDWHDVYNKKYIPPFKPKLRNKMDLRHISSSYTGCNLARETIDPVMSYNEKKERHMSEFSYTYNDESPDSFMISD